MPDEQVPSPVEEIVTVDPNAAAPTGEPEVTVADAPQAAVAPEQSDAAAELARQLEHVRRERDALGQRAARAETYARSSNEQSQYDSIVGTINQVAAEAANLQAELRAALDNADYEKSAEITRHLGRLDARLENLEGHKANWEGHFERQRAAYEQAVRNPPPPQTEQERFEATIAQYTPASREYLRRHPDYVLDPKKTQALVRAHHKALGAGVQHESREYFARIDHEMRGGGNGALQPSTRGGFPAAPVTREPANYGGGMSGGGTVEVPLTREEREVATDGTIRWMSGPKKGQPIGTQEYARRKLENIRSGKMDNTGRSA
jgi:hypothetical protein